MNKERKKLDEYFLSKYPKNPTKRRNERAAKLFNRVSSFLPPKAEQVKLRSKLLIMNERATLDSLLTKYRVKDATEGRNKRARELFNHKPSELETFLPQKAKQVELRSKLLKEYEKSPPQDKNFIYNKENNYKKEPENKQSESNILLQNNILESNNSRSSKGKSSENEELSESNVSEYKEGDFFNEIDDSFKNAKENAKIEYNQNSLKILTGLRCLIMTKGDIKEFTEEELNKIKNFNHSFLLKEEKDKMLQFINEIMLEKSLEIKQSRSSILKNEELSKSKLFESEKRSEKISDLIFEESESDNLSEKKEKREGKRRKKNKVKNESSSISHEEEKSSGLFGNKYFESEIREMDKELGEKNKRIEKILHDKKKEEGEDKMFEELEKEVETERKQKKITELESELKNLKRRTDLVSDMTKKLINRKKELKSLWKKERKK